METGFNPHREITNPVNLFGRDQLLKQLTILANNRSSVSIVGLRRFGKTSLLKCLETVLKNDIEAKVFPIYFDFKEVGSIVRGTDNVYRYMISKLSEQLYLENVFESTTSFKRKEITPSDDWTEVYLNLMDVNPVRIQGLFEEIVCFFSQILGKTILFLIDEYEHLFRFSFTQPEGFMKLRNLSSKRINEDIIPFNFFVCGAITWEHLCTITGSGELNCIDHTCYVTPIDFDSYKSMWKYESNLLKNCSEELRSADLVTYQKVGGVPFYGKIIGNYWNIKSSIPHYFVLQSYFHEVLNSLTVEQRRILNELVSGPKKIIKSNLLIDLVEKGLLNFNKSEYSIRIEFLIEYLRADCGFLNGYNGTPLTELLVDEIAKLIITINNTNKSKKGKYVFDPVNDEHALIKDLRSPCTSAAMFSDFANSLYKIVFERTKANVNGVDSVLNNLPSPYKRGHQFVDIVDILRHSLGGGHLMDKFTLRKNQMTKEKMLTILVNSRNEPNSSEEYLALQIATLKMFEKELRNINTIVRAMK